MGRENSGQLVRYAVSSMSHKCAKSVHVTRLSAIMVLMGLTLCARGEERVAFGPIPFRTQNPLYLQMLGPSRSGTRVLGEGRTMVRFDLNSSNMLELDTNWDGDEVRIDMELTRLAMTYCHGLGSDVELSVEIPFLYGAGGSFDHLIEEFHQLFGLPNGRRELVADNRFEYTIRSGDAVIYELPRLRPEMGDIAVGIRRLLWAQEAGAPAAAWSFRCKLPTGDPALGTGSGGFDAGFGLALEKTVSRWSWYVNFDLVAVSKHELIGDFHKSGIFAWLLAAEYGFGSTMSATVQVQGSTPLLRAVDVPAWGGPPVDIVFGVQGRGSLGGRELVWRAAFQEDLYPDGPAVDVGIMLSAGLQF